jgi:hypothetical protein
MGTNIGWDVAEWLECLTANAELTIVLGSIPTSTDTFPKISSPDSLMTTYQVNLISAESIWLDNTFCNSENHISTFPQKIVL